MGFCLAFSAPSLFVLMDLGGNVKGLLLVNILVGAMVATQAMAWAIKWFTYCWTCYAVGNVASAETSAWQAFEYLGVAFLVAFCVWYSIRFFLYCQRQ